MIGSTSEVTSADFDNYATKYGIDFGLTSNNKQEEDSSQVIEKKSPLKNSVLTDSDAIQVAEEITQISEPVVVEKGYVDHKNMEKALVKESLPLDSLYLRNIPQDSLIQFTDRFMILPNETTAFFQDGGRIYRKPMLRGGTPTRFCMMTFSDSGKGRRATDKTNLLVSEVVEHNSLFQKNDKDSGTLVRVTKIIVDNPELKQVVCMGAGISQPLSIGDMDEITGGLLNVKIQNYIDI
ncbi:hypothetical protein EA58_14130 [Photobacterium galatheae]|uniref:Uncharacterized protein n=2 Tax=Photobacterium galatheae TaxID=1654360 RepID=A0A066RKM5_9GAMM|nr:hypothetical protein EA58_14130 [Photobacterium galatheae]